MYLLTLLTLFNLIKHLRFRQITIDPPLGKKTKGAEEIYQYKEENWPTTAEKWDEPRYLHKAHIGYYTWPRKLEIYAPSAQQPNLKRERNELNEQEQEIDDFFSNEQNVQKLINYLKIEGNKGEDSFDVVHYQMFKGLFRNHGDTYLSNFLPHLHEMVKDSQESTQRCAAEIIAGLIRGTKHWPFDMTQNMWEQLKPIIKVALNNIIEETVDDWSSCFMVANFNRDPNRMYWLIETLIEESEHAQSETSYLEAAKFMILHRMLEDQAWRMRAMFQDRLLPRIENRLLQMPF